MVDIIKHKEYIELVKTKGETNMYVLIGLSLLIVLGVIGYKQSKRGESINKAIDNLDDIKAQVKIKKINQEADELLASINEKSGEEK